MVLPDFVFARGYIPVKEEDEDGILIDVRSPLDAILHRDGRDCFGKTVLLEGLTEFVVFSEYILLEDDDFDEFLEVRSPSGAIVHNNEPSECGCVVFQSVVLCRRYVLGLGFWKITNCEPALEMLRPSRIVIIIILYWRTGRHRTLFYVYHREDSRADPINNL